MAITGIPIEKYQIEYESVFTVDEASAKRAKMVAEQVGTTTKIQSGEEALLRLQQDRLTVANRINAARAKESVIGNAANIRTGEEALLRIEQARAETVARINAAKSKEAVIGNAAGIRSGEEALMAIEAKRLQNIQRINQAKATSAVVGNAAGIRSGEEAILAIEEKRLRTAQALNDKKAKGIAIELKAQATAGGVVSSGDVAAQKLAERQALAQAEATTRLAAANEYNSRSYRKVLAALHLTKQATAENIAGISQDTLATNRNTEAKRRNASVGGPTDELGQKKNSFGHKVFSTAQYTAAAAGIFAVASAFKTAGAAVVEFDTASRTLSAVIQDLSLDKARELETQLIKLGVAFGGSIEDINKSAILLGRAGIAQEDLIKSTEVVIKLSKITGDTLDSTSGALISYLEVFGKAGETVESLADKLAFMANESRLSTQGIETFSNFALAAADAAGLTVDAVSALATEFSKAGVSESTIGTQIRSLTKVFLDNAQSVKSFFADIGVVQANFQAELAAGGKRSNDAIIALSKNLAGLTREEFNRVTASMDILQRNSLTLLRQQSEGIAEDINILTTNAHSGIKAADVVLAGYVVTWEKLKATMTDTIIAADKAVGASTAFDSILKFENYRLGLQKAFLSEGISGATDFIQIQAVQEKLYEKAVTLKQKELELSKAINATDKLAAYEKFQAATKEFKTLEKRLAVLKGEDPTTVGTTKTDDINRITKQIDATKSLIQIFEDKNRTLEHELSLGKADAARKTQITALQAEYTDAIRESKKEVESFEKQLGKVKGVQTDEKVVALVAKTTQDTKNMTTATLEFYKAGKLTLGDMSAPIQDIGNSISVVQSKIKKLAESDGVDGAFDGLLAKGTSLEEISLSSVKIQKVINEAMAEREGLSQAEIEAKNKVINAGRAIIDQNDVARTQAIELQKIQTARLTALDKQIAEAIKLEQLGNAKRSADRKELIDQTDKAALAEEDVRLAKENVATAQKYEATKRNVLKLEADKVALANKEAELANVITDLAEKQRKYTASFNEDMSKRVAKVQAEINGNHNLIGLAGQRLDVENQRKALLVDMDNALVEIQRKGEDEKLTQGEINKQLDARRGLYQTQSLQLDQQQAKLTITNQIMEQGVDLLGQQIGDAIFNATQGIDSWKDAAEGFRQGLLKIAIQLMVMEPLMNSLRASMGVGAGAGASAGIGSLFGFAKGGVFTQGSADNRYATGGVVTRPTLFPQTSGNIGLMGEAGPEAILPLTRVNGDLGVKAQISGEIGTGSTEITIINESGIPMDLKETSRKKDDKGKEFVTLLMTTLNYNSSVRQAIKSL